MSKSYIPVAIRQRVRTAAKHRCGYCLTQEEVVGTLMEIDHLIPESRGGPTEEDNLWLACSMCNDYRGNRLSAPDSDTGEVVRIFDPRHQLWADHFLWHDSREIIIGVTPVGRATIALLNLNLPVRVNARRLWVAAGWHPPKD